MKIKMLLVCLLAVIGFSSCNNEDYTDLYTGYYDVKITQNLKVIAPIYGEIPLQEENIYGTAQIVKDENEGDSNVKILMSFRQGGIYYLDAYCDQTCMRIENKDVNATHIINSYNNVRFDYTLNGANVYPDDMSWTSRVAGTCTTNAWENSQKTYEVSGTLKFTFTQNTNN